MKIFLLITFFLAIFIIGIVIYKNVKKRENPLVIIIMGAPGSGKGTHATELSKKLHLPHISTGDLLRENIRNNTQLGQQAKTLIDEGKLVPDDMVTNMLFNTIKEKGFDKKGYILDGFPRTTNQAIALDKNLNDAYHVMVINLNIDEKLLEERITGRLMCKSCGTPYHKKYFPPKKDNICDKCSAELYQRQDDTKEALQTRLQAYEKQTKPLLDYYKKQANLYEVDANLSKEEVFENILKIIKYKK